MIRYSTIVFTSMAVLTAVVTTPLVSRANALIPASACMKEATSLASPIYHNGTLLNVNPPSTANIFCPIVETSTNFKGSFSHALVDIFDSSTSGEIVAQACSQPFTGASKHCGASVRSGISFSGTTTIDITGSNLSDGWSSLFTLDYGYLSVSFPAQLGHTLFGVFLT